MKKIMIGAVLVCAILLTVVGAQASVNAYSGFGIINNTNQTFTDKSGKTCQGITTPTSIGVKTDISANPIKFADLNYFGDPCTVTYTNSNGSGDKFTISFSGISNGDAQRHIRSISTSVSETGALETVSTYLFGFKISPPRPGPAIK